MTILPADTGFRPELDSSDPAFDQPAAPRPFMPRLPDAPLRPVAPGGRALPPLTATSPLAPVDDTAAPAQVAPMPMPMPMPTMPPPAPPIAPQYVYRPVQFSPVGPPPRRRKPVAGRVLSAVVLVGLSVGIRQLASMPDRHDPGTTSRPAVTTPAAWDPRVTNLVAFVEEHRGHTFQHPVDVEFLAEADFVALFDADDQEISDADRATAEEYTASLNAGGLAGNYDAIAGQQVISQVTTLGFYSFYDDAIFVRGATVTPALEVTLVHELTHALQSQTFDFELGGENDLRVRAIVEGDAMRIEDEYTASLPGASQQEAINGTSADPESEEQLTDVPWAVVDASYAPYVLGPMFLEVIAESGGNAAVDRVFANFPTEEELVTPARYALHEAELDVRADAPDGAHLIGSAHSWQMLDALVMLDAWLPWNQARTPFDAWHGGGQVDYRRGEDGPVCFTAKASFDDGTHANLFAAAITAWAAAAGSAATPITDAAHPTDVSFEACQRPAGAALPPRPEFSTTEAAYVEQELVEQIALPVADEAAGIDRCLVRTLMDDPAMTEIFHAADLTEDQTNTIVQRRDQARWDCTAATRTSE